MSSPASRVLGFAAKLDHLLPPSPGSGEKRFGLGLPLELDKEPAASAFNLSRLRMLARKFPNLTEMPVAKPELFTTIAKSPFHSPLKASPKMKSAAVRAFGSPPSPRVPLSQVVQDPSGSAAFKSDEEEVMGEGAGFEDFELSSLATCSPLQSKPQAYSPALRKRKEPDSVENSPLPASAQLSPKPIEGSPFKRPKSSNSSAENSPLPASAAVSASVSASKHARGGHGALQNPFLPVSALGMSPLPRQGISSLPRSPKTPVRPQSWFGGISPDSTPKGSPQASLSSDDESSQPSTPPVKAAPKQKETPIKVFSAAITEKAKRDELDNSLLKEEKAQSIAFWVRIKQLPDQPGEQGKAGRLLAFYNWLIALITQKAEEAGTDSQSLVRDTDWLAAMIRGVRDAFRSCKHKPPGLNELPPLVNKKHLTEHQTSKSGKDSGFHIASDQSDARLASAHSTIVNRANGVSFIFAQGKKGGKGKASSVFPPAVIGQGVGAGSGAGVVDPVTSFVLSGKRMAKRDARELVSFDGLPFVAERISDGARVITAYPVFHYGEYSGAGCRFSVKATVGGKTEDMEVTYSKEEILAAALIAVDDLQRYMKYTLPSKRIVLELAPNLAKTASLVHQGIYLSFTADELKDLLRAQKGRLDRMVEAQCLNLDFFCSPDEEE